MKRVALWSSVLLLGMGSWAIAAPPNDATPAAPEQTQPAQQPQAQQQQQTQQQQAQRTPAGRLDDVTSGSTVRASELIGMDIDNPQGEGIAEINDLVVDANTGEIRYAAVSYGGFLGLGDKLFAVPWQAIKFQQGEDADEVHLVLNVTEQQLEGAQGFNQDNWPNFADKKFVADLHKRYGVEMRTGYRGVEVEQERQTQPKTGEAQPKRGVEPQPAPELDDTENIEQ